MGNWYLPPTSGNKENLKEFLYLEKEENPKRAEQTNEILKDNKKDRWSPEKRGPKSIKWKRNYNQHHKIHKKKKTNKTLGQWNGQMWTTKKIPDWLTGWFLNQTSLILLKLL